MEIEMSAPTSPRWIAIAMSLFFALIAGQVFGVACDDSRACRNNTTCRRPAANATAGVDAGSSPGASVYGFLCNIETALCYTSCKDDSQCDQCNFYRCDTSKGNCVYDAQAAAAKKAPDFCCVTKTEFETKADNSKCNGFICQAGLGQCRKECSDDTHCDLCRQYSCNFSSGKCEKDASRGKPTTCEPIPERVTEPAADGGGGTEPAGGDAGAPDEPGDDAGTGTDDSQGE
jgi:hypothetical protein